MNKLTERAINGYRHKDYDYLVENSMFYRQIVTGEEYGELVVNYKPRESDEQKVQRVAITQNRTKSVSGKVEGFFKRTFRADKLAFEVSHSNESDNEKIRQYVDRYGNDGQSLLVWSEEAALFYNDVDPNAFYWVKHKRKTEEDDFDPFVFSCAQVTDFKITKGVVKNCVCKLQKRVSFMGEAKKQMEQPIDIYHTFTEDGLELAIEINENVFKYSDFYDNYNDSNGDLIGEEEKVNGKTYLVIFEESEIDVLPITRIGYNHDKKTNGRTYTPFWDKASEEYRILVNDGSVFDVSKVLHGFPMKFVYYVPCNFQSTDNSSSICKNGTMWPSGHKCGQCGGTGKIVHISAQDVVEVKLPTEDEPQMVKPADMAAYVKQPSEALEMQKALVYEATPKIIETIFGVDIATKNNVATTATEVVNHFDTAQDALFEFTKSPRRMFLFAVDIMARYLGIEGIEAALIYTNEYNLESVQELLGNLKKAKDAGANPVIVKSISNKIIQKQNRNNASFLSLHNVMSQFEPYSNVPQEILNAIIPNLPNQSVQKALFLNFAEIMADIETNEKTFLKKTYKQQRDIVYSKAQAFVDRAMEDNSVRGIAGLGITDEEPQEE